MPDHRYPLMINGVPVVEAPEEIDICNAEQLRIVLLEAASRGHATIVFSNEADCLEPVAESDREDRDDL